MPCEPRNLILAILLALITLAFSTTNAKTRGLRINELQDRIDSVGIAATANARGLRINEVQVADNLPPSSGLEPWVELVNTGAVNVSLEDFLVRTDSSSWQLPAGTLAPREVRVVHSPVTIDRPGELFLHGDVTEIALVGKASNAIVDSVTLPMAVVDESFGRYPDGTGRFRVFSAEEISYSRPNRDTGFVRKLASTTAFRPRDSSPNAIVRHRGQFWILGGWSHFPNDVWTSAADVWRSSDLKRWQLVNQEPPYSPYNCFVTWRDRIWSIGAESYSSADGVTWRKEASQPCGRAVPFKHGIVVVAGATISMTRDGMHWDTLTTAAPWGNSRAQPHVVVHRNRLWVIGGFSGYGTPDEVLYNDVWSSSDGVTWDLINAYSDWEPRRWATAAVYDDKIFLIGGANPALWPDEHGNTNEVWFTSDGTAWMKLEAERLWPARHAAYVTTGIRQDLAILAGYGHGGTSRIYNDAWSLKTRIYFSKPSGNLHKLSSWGRNMDGSGAQPKSFSADHQLFVLRNRDSFKMDQRLSVSGGGSRIIVGDGNMDKPVRLELLRYAATASQPLYLYGNSTITVKGHLPEVLYQDDRARLLVQHSKPQLAQPIRPRHQGSSAGPTRLVPP